MSKQYNAFDVTLGARLKMMRLSKNKSQEDLGRAVGVTFQQIQKYEKGTNTVKAWMLVAFADELDCSFNDLLPSRKTINACDRQMQKESARYFQRLMALDKPTRKAVIRTVSALLEYRTTILCNVEVANA